MEKNTLINLLREEIEESTGCTDPGGVCLAVSRATRELGELPEKIEVIVSENIFKNGVSVGIPGTGKRGLDLAAALGALIDKSESGLAILNYITEDIIIRANDLIKDNIITIKHTETEDPLYIKAKVCAGNNSSFAVIRNDYSNIVEVGFNGETISHKNKSKVEETEDILKRYKVKDLYELILTMKFQELEFLKDYALINKDAAIEGLEDSNLRLGRNILDKSKSLTEPYSVMNKGQAITAAAGEARMSGLNVPIMAIAGSGNHGITNFLGILSVAEELDSSEEDTVKALAISSMITIYIKCYVKRMTAFCGCAVAAATGVAAGTVYLLGGTHQQGVNAMQSVIGTLAGMFCDGAKESCAYKLSTATTMAIQFSYMSMNDSYIPSAMGIVGKTIEETFENLGLLNNPGMVETDKVIVALVEKNLED